MILSFFDEETICLSQYYGIFLPRGERLMSPRIFLLIPVGGVLLPHRGWGKDALAGSSVCARVAGLMAWFVGSL